MRQKWDLMFAERRMEENPGTRERRTMPRIEPPEGVSKLGSYDPNQQTKIH